MLGSMQTMVDKPHHSSVLFRKLQVQGSEMQHVTSDQLTLTLEFPSSVSKYHHSIVFFSHGGLGEIIALAMISFKIKKYHF